MKSIEEFLIPTQDQLFSMLCSIFKGKMTAYGGSYILVEGEAPIMLLAHMDTVHREPVRDMCKTCDGNILMSPQGIGSDDRCGIYALVMIYEKSEIKPWLLFTCDEEIGCVGAATFSAGYRAGKLPKELDALKCMIEIDRRGENDAVYYDCGNNDFEDYIAGKGFMTEWGSSSDISEIAPEIGVAAVNLSSGYYNAHTLHEYINRKHLNTTIERVQSIVADAAKPEFQKYKYIQAAYNHRYFPGAYYSMSTAEST